MPVAPGSRRMEANGSENKTLRLPSASGRARKQVPRLRIAIEKANRNAALGITDFGEVSLGRLSF